MHNHLITSRSCGPTIRGQSRASAGHQPALPIGHARHARRGSGQERARGEGVAVGARRLEPRTDLDRADAAQIEIPCDQPPVAAATQLFVDAEKHGRDVVIVEIVGRKPDQTLCKIQAELVARGERVPP